jgi:hypothetical protein
VLALGPVADGQGQVLRPAPRHAHVQALGPVPALEARRLQHPSEQRVHRRRHTDLARQHAPEMLQCVAVPSGTGKSHLLIGLGIAACEQGRRVRYVTCAQLVNELVEAADERRLSRIVARYGLDLLCLDELGYVQLDPRGAELLFQIVSEREEKAPSPREATSPSASGARSSPTPA